MNLLRALRDFILLEPYGHGSTALKYVQDNVLLEGGALFEGYFGTPRIRGELCLIPQDTAVR
jgi:hypothetical protein